MIARLFSGYINNITAELVEVEVSASKGLRSFSIVGLADTAVKEAKERVSIALKSAGLEPPHQQNKKVLVNLAPADIKKSGSFYDLSIALGFALSTEQITFNPNNKLILGELALDGSLRPIKGAFLFSLLANERSFKELIIPYENLNQAKMLKGSAVKVIAVKTLTDVIAYLTGKENYPVCQAANPIAQGQNNSFEVDFSWIKGQATAKRALILSAAGGHNLMLEGPPGAGKTLLAKSAISILPELEQEEQLEVNKIYSAMGLMPAVDSLIAQRPFRAPHHSSSEAGLIGGGTGQIKPGEITLSNRGVLFLDEFAEFHRDVLEALRQPLESGTITVQRANQRAVFPARFTLIAASNPCPCGFKNDPQRECSCNGSQIASYKRKLSGPLMDRIDLFAWVSAVKFNDLIQEKTGDSQTEKKLIKGARLIQRERLKKDGLFTNSEMGLLEIKKHCPIDSASQRFLKQFVDSGKLSARGFHKVLKIARTIADLKQQGQILPQDIMEAVNFRQRSD